MRSGRNECFRLISNLRYVFSVCVCPRRRIHHGNRPLRTHFNIFNQFSWQISISGFIIGLFALYFEQNAAEVIDKQCNAAVSDLIATIAKLDSNGVQVLAENHGRAKTTSPQVSSTEYMPPTDGKPDLFEIIMENILKNAHFSSLSASR